MTPTLSLDAAFVATLDRFAADPVLEREWIDLLSQMEYVGCRKIIKAVPYERMTVETLQHLSEEASHAFLLKAAAEKIGLEPRSWKNGRFSEPGWRYFQGLDRGIESQSPEPELCYPLVSAAVERRVLALYPAVLERTSSAEVRKAVALILAQEKRHALRFDELALPPGALALAYALEERLWTGLASSLATRV